MRLHTVTAAAVFIAAALFGLSPVRWLLLSLAVTLVISAELINTAVEAAVDLVSPGVHPLAQVAKDAAAGAVLVTAVFSVIIGVYVFYEPVVSWISSLISP